MKVLLLHGGPGATHEYLEIFERYLPAAGIEFYFYDQLGSGHSDRPDEPDLWELDRFVDEVEQVRQALGLDRSNFVLFGQSWGGILAMEYALHHREHLKGLVVSNMMSSCPAYNTYAHDVLMPAMDQAVLAEIKGFEARAETGDPRYGELLMEHHYVHHVLRMPAGEWPDPVTRSFADINPQIYVSMQGPSELGLSGKLSDWDRTDDLGRIEVPTLVIGARHDTMDPAFMRDDGRPLSERPLPRVPERQPPRDVGRHGDLLRGPDRLPSGPRVGAPDRTGPAAAAGRRSPLPRAPGASAW